MSPDIALGSIGLVSRKLSDPVPREALVSLLALLAVRAAHAVEPESAPRRSPPREFSRFDDGDLRAAVAVGRVRLRGKVVTHCDVPWPGADRVQVCTRPGFYWTSAYREELDIVPAPPDVAVEATRPTSRPGVGLRGPVRVDDLYELIVDADGRRLLDTVVLGVDCRTTPEEIVALINAGLRAVDIAS